MDPRFLQAREWATQQTGYLTSPIQSMQAASVDASFRRYFRIITAQQRCILMDAPPEQENVTKFVQNADALRAIQVKTPTIYARDDKNGFLLLEDFGDTTYLSALTQCNLAPDTLYRQAIDSLVQIQSGPRLTPTALSLPAYDADWLSMEFDLFREWYVERHLGVELIPKHVAILSALKTTLVDACLEQPQTWVHRDFHSRNLMLIDGDQPGVLDFQDMVTGPLTYDIASLLKDCYVAWPRTQQMAWLASYWQRASMQLKLPDIDFATLTRWYDFTALQRHMKVLGIFCRLNYRDQKPHYMNDLPLVANYVLDTLARYPDFCPVQEALGDLIAQAANA
ncbi:aminoglycoside phosphotransferase [Arenicella chitinivorans]|uniref:Aminoglycoside phosphotransferase n=1 Tax=Arenicella chitinivorans TaxID=1329800 RepID=A0A918VR25_9GAMM|nr:phosphotransferase [Arenicella chitinivorans]GHA16035.1 aminoglycoside phosphotransferase [Arenicella chitinivorans]